MRVWWLLHRLAKTAVNCRLGMAKKSLLGVGCCSPGRWVGSWVGRRGRNGSRGWATGVYSLVIALVGFARVNSCCKPKTKCNPALARARPSWRFEQLSVSGRHRMRRRRRPREAPDTLLSVSVEGGPCSSAHLALLQPSRSLCWVEALPGVGVSRGELAFQGPGSSKRPE